MKAEQINELYKLLNALREGVITDAQFDRLDAWLSSDEHACQVYVDYVKMWAELESFQTAAKPGYDPLLADSLQPDEKTVIDPHLWRQLAENERTAPTIQIEKHIENEPVEPIVFERIKVERKVSKFSIFTVVFSAAAMLLLVLMVKLNPIRPTVALLTDSINAEWLNAKGKPFSNDVLKQGDALTLAKGLVEITFDDGAVVIIEAPAVIEIESPKSMFLASGKVSAVVSEYAIGFTVNTPSATVVDLGTEFGVSVEGDGQCSLHMFKGKANLIAGQIGQKRTSQVVAENEAKSVDAITGVIRPVQFFRKGFVRRIDSASAFVWRGQNLNLADIVGGGNGFSEGQYGYSVDPLTGLMNADLRFGTRKVEARFIPVPDCSFIDGVFVPDGEKEVVVSTQNHVFKECPDTNSQVYSPIVNVPVGWGNTIETTRLHFGAEVYGGAARPAISMEPNLGITYDLEAIRKTLPEGVTIEQLQAICGISSEVIPRWNMNVKASIWVLVDGQVRYEAVNIDVLSGKHNVQVELSESDRFLTLVATDGGDRVDNSDANNHDACFFGRPVLILN